MPTVRSQALCPQRGSSAVEVCPAVSLLNYYRIVKKSESVPHSVACFLTPVASVAPSTDTDVLLISTFSPKTANAAEQAIISCIRLVSPIGERSSVPELFYGGLRRLLSPSPRWTPVGPACDDAAR